MAGGLGPKGPMARCLDDDLTKLNVDGKVALTQADAATVKLSRELLGLTGVVIEVRR